MPGVLNRTTFEMHRALEFFTERELQMQIGYPGYPLKAGHLVTSMG